MGYKNFACMNVAIIGDGPVTEAIVRRLAETPNNIFIGSKTEHPLVSENLFREYSNIVLATIEYAAVIADVIIIATPQEDVREAAYLLDDVRNKVIIDMSGFHFPKFSNYVNTLSAIGTITSSPYIVKCYSSGGAEGMLDVLSRKHDHVMYFAGDSRKAKEMLKLLSKDMGFTEYHDFGYNEDVADMDKIALSGKFLVTVKR